MSGPPYKMPQPPEGTTECSCGYKAKWSEYDKDHPCTDKLLLRGFMTLIVLAAVLPIIILIYQGIREFL